MLRCATLRFVSILSATVALPCQASLGLGAHLDGAQAGTASAATGWAFLQLQSGGAVSVTVDVDLAGANACELRLGAGGGTLLLALGGGPRTWTGTAVLAAADAQALAAGNGHLLERSAAFPAGELRGQVRAPRSRRFQAVLTPGSLVPPQSYAASGAVDAFLWEPDDRLVVVIASVTGARPVREYQLRLGASGANGPLLHTFPAITSQGHAFGPTRKLTATEIQALVAGDLYVEAIGEPAIFTPNGPLARGQLRQPPLPWNGTLTGAEVVPPSASTAQALAGCFQRTVAGEWVFWVDRHNFGEIACHVRRGQPGSNGPIVFSLLAGTVKWLQTRQLTAAELAELQNGEWYFERVTQTSPAEVRAQIVPAGGDQASPYGGGCPGGGGTQWYLVESHGVPAVGAHTYSLVHYELRLVANGLLPAGGMGYLVVGFRRDQNGPAALPLRLDPYGGAPSCYLLTEAAVVLIAQSGGTTWDQLWIPSDPGLRGLGMFAQGVMFDPGAQGFFAVSNGLAVTIR